MNRKNKFLAMSALASVLCLGVVAPAAYAAVPHHAAVSAAVDGAPSAPVYKEPQDLSEAANDVMLAVRLKKMGQWLSLALVVTQLVIFGIKKVPQTSDKMKKYGTLIVLCLSAGAGVLALVVGGMSWPEALMVFLGTGAPKFAQDLMHDLGIVDHSKDESGQPLDPQADPHPPDRA